MSMKETKVLHLVNFYKLIDLKLIYTGFKYCLCLKEEKKIICPAGTEKN